MFTVIHAYSTEQKSLAHVIAESSAKYIVLGKLELLKSKPEPYYYFFNGLNFVL